MLYRGPFTTEFYRQLHTILHKEFRARNYRDELKQLARRPRSIRRKHVRSAAAMTAHTMSLPLERRRLNRLARIPHTGFAPVPLAADPTAAATPTPQSDT
jgi:anaerobic magnesium-protoporphyrin IX monomethyl ester cyclase